MAEMWTLISGSSFLCVALVLQLNIVASQPRTEGTKVPGLGGGWNTPDIAWTFPAKDSYGDPSYSSSRNTDSHTGRDDISENDAKPAPSTSSGHPVTSAVSPVSNATKSFSTASVNTSSTSSTIQRNESPSVPLGGSSNNDLENQRFSYPIPNPSESTVFNDSTGHTTQHNSTSDHEDRRYTYGQTQQEQQKNDFLFRTSDLVRFLTTRNPSLVGSTQSGNRATDYGVPSQTGRGQDLSSDSTLSVWETSQSTVSPESTSEGGDGLYDHQENFGGSVRGTQRTFANSVEYPTPKSTQTENDELPLPQSTQSDRDMVSFLTGVDLDSAEENGRSRHWTNGPEVRGQSLSHFDYQQTNSGRSSPDTPAGQPNNRRNISAPGQHVEPTTEPGDTGLEQVVITKIGANHSGRDELLDRPADSGNGKSQFAHVNVSNDHSDPQGRYGYGGSSENRTRPDFARNSVHSEQAEPDLETKTKYGIDSESPHGTDLVYGQNSDQNMKDDYAEMVEMYDSGSVSYEDFFGNGTNEIDYHTDFDNKTDAPDDECLYDVFGASGTLKFPDVHHFIVSENKEFITCRWRIRVPEGPNIRVVFERLALSLGVEHVEIAVGMDGELKKRTYTGSKIPRDVITVGPRMWLTARVRNDNYVEKIVLHFAETTDEGTFPVQDNYTCGAILSNMKGNISSPGYPDINYSDNQECSWYIVGPTDSVIRLTVLDFITDVYDHVTLGIGLHAGATSTKLLTLFGHLQEQRETVIPANSLWIRFTSDDSETDRGFFISYQVIPREICNGSNVLTEPEGEVTSPGYPAQYRINSECTWYIQASPTAAFINITFQDLSLQDGRDFLLAGEGEHLFGGPFETYTGNVTPSQTLQLETSVMWIHFTSDHLEENGVHRGFRLSYRVVDKKTLESIQEADEEEGKDNQENMVMPELPSQNDEGTSRVFKIPLSGVNDTQLDSKIEEFKSLVADILNKHCAGSIDDEKKCGSNIKPEDVRVVSKQQRQRRLVVTVSLAAHTPATLPDMASTDYEELERLFHSDLQSLDLQDEETSDKVSSHLPEWLIGVIVVVILLIVAFFAMVIYSLMKERKKSRAGSYGGTTSTGSACEDLESGKSNGTIRFTPFSNDSNDKDADATTANGSNGHTKDGANGWTLDNEAASTLQRRQPGVSGCMNPAFIDDDPDKDEDEKKSGEDNSKKDNKDEGQTSKEDDKNSKDGGKSTKDGKRGKSPFKSAKSPTAKSKSPKATKNTKADKNNEESAAAVSNGDSSTGKSAENGAVVTQTAAEPKDGGTTTEDKVEDTKQSTEDNTTKVVEASPDDSQQPSTSGSGGGLEVMVEREVTQSQPKDEIVLQVHNDGKHSEQGQSSESSTDEKEDNTDMSTNL